MAQFFGEFKKLNRPVRVIKLAGKNPVSKDKNTMPLIPVNPDRRPRPDLDKLRQEFEDKEYEGENL